MKRLCVLALFFGIAASLFATGGKEAVESGDGSGPITIKWAIWDYDLTVYYKPLIDAYQAKNPQVKIEPVDLGSADYMTVLGTQLSGGADLDVLCIKDIPGYANLVRQNRLEPLNGYIRAAGVNTSLYGGTTEQIAVNGEVYALPFRSDFWLIFYNKDLFDAAGVLYPSNDLTLDEYDVLARRVTQGSGASKTYGAHYHTWRSAVQLFGILDGKNTIVDGTYGFLAPYYERVLREQNDGIVQSYAALKTSGTHYSGAFFNNQIAMMNMGTWFIATQIEKVRTGESLSKNWGLAKYPHPSGVQAGTTLGTITSIAVNRNSKNKEAALDFMRFISGPEGAAILAKTGTIPAIMNQEVVNAIAAIPGFPSDSGSKGALQVYKTYLEMPLHEKSADIEIVLNEIHDDIMTGNTSVAQGIQEMNDRVGRILGK
ncbi:MAG: sugar ABC transporter substrate-binding protein [Treponema sp.]|jgi:multiple sugar transport system substrate-binding protein|nr:sugar ABC transporter substrate-binding protein [Treponema sp.]